MTYRPKVYTASRLERQPLWRALTTDPDWDFIEWTAQWVGQKIDQEAEVSPEDYRALWSMDLYDVRRSDFLLLFGEDGLRGALVEAGCALGNGIRVLAIGLNADHSWTYHPMVTRLPSLEEARYYLFRHTIMIPHRRRIDHE